MTLSQTIDSTRTLGAAPHSLGSAPFATSLKGQTNKRWGTNNTDNVEQVIIDNPVAGTYLVRISHKGMLKESDLVSGDPSDPSEGFDAVFQHTAGGDQALSLILSGNLDMRPQRPVLSHPVFSSDGLLVNFDLEAVVGLRYQLEGSTDLINWDEMGFSFDVVSPVQTLTPAAQSAGMPHRYYRVKEFTPLNE